MAPEIPNDDRVRLRHMLDASREAREFTAGRGRTDLDADRMFRRAIVSCIQEIGEAAVRVSPETRQLLASVPWRQIVAMRNRLVHVYFAINPDFVWEVVNRDLGPLIRALAEALGEEHG